jgi:hypothetical protein
MNIRERKKKNGKEKERNRMKNNGKQEGRKRKEKLSNNFAIG